jgi:hypothetical protein
VLLCQLHKVAGFGLVGIGAGFVAGGAADRGAVHVSVGVDGIQLDGLVEIV